MTNAISAGAAGRQSGDFTLEIDDQRASELYAKFDMASPLEQEQYRSALRNWAEQKVAQQQSATYDELQKVYEDVGSWWKDSGGNDAPDEVRFGAANRKFIAAQLQTTAREMGDLYPTYRDQWFLKTFRKQPKTETEAFNTIRESLAAEKQVNQSYDLITGDIALALFDQVNKGTPVDVPALFTKWKEENAEILAALPDDWEANALKAAGEYYAENEKMLREHGGTLQRLYGHIVAATGRKVEGAPEDDVKTVEDLNAIIDELGQLPQEVRQRGYTAILMAARRQGMEDKGFWEMAAEAWPRTLNTVRTTGLVAQETDAEAKVNLLRGDNPIFINKATGQVTPPSGTAFSPQDFEPVTDEQRGELLQQAETELQRFNVIRELRDLADNRFDPVKSNAKNGVLKFVQDIAIMGPQSLAYTAMAAVPVAGPFLTGAAIYADEYNQLRLEGMSSSQARTLAAVSAPLQTAAEVFGAKLLFGRYKWYRETIQKLINPARFARSSQAAVSFFGKVVGENITEGVQDLTTPLVKDVASALSEEYPDVNWEETLGRWKDSRLEVMAATLMPVIGGSLVETFNNNERFASARRRVQLLYKPMGITDEEVRYIEDGTTPEERTKRYTETLSGMSAERVQTVKDNIASQSRLATGTQEDATQPTLETQKDTNGRLTYIVRDETGKEVYRSTKQAAAEEAFILTSARSTAARFNEEKVQLRELVEWWNTADPKRADNEERVVRDTMQGTAQQKLEALQQANNKQGIEELHRRIAQSPYAGTPYDQIQILGEASVEQVGEMVFRSVIALNKNSRVRDAREEMHHTAVRMAVANGRANEQTMREWLDATERVFAEKGLGITLPRADMTDIVESMAVVQEAFENERISADVEMSLPQAFVDYIKRMIQVLAEVLKRGKAIREALDAGALPAEFEAFLVETTGVADQTAVDRARERTEQEVGAPATTNYSLNVKRETVDVYDNQTARELLKSVPLDSEFYEIARTLSRLNLPQLDTDVVEINRKRDGAARTAYGSRILSPSDTMTARTAVHEVVHTLTSDAIDKYVGRKPRNGQAYIKHLRNVMADAATPEPIRNLIEVYFATIDRLGLNDDLLGKTIDYVVPAKRRAFGFRRANFASGTQYYLDYDTKDTELLVEFMREQGVEFATDAFGDQFLTEQQMQTVVEAAQNAGHRPRLTDDFVFLHNFEVAPAKSRRKTTKAFVGTGARKVTREAMRVGIINPITQDFLTNGQMYGLANLDEFLAQALSSKEFQELLNSIPAANDTKSLWDKLVEAVARLLNWTGSETMLNSALTALSQVAEMRVLSSTDYFGNTYTRGDEAPTNYSIAVTPQQDTDYLAAVERGDMETAQRMVDEAAKAAGYKIRAFHGTSENITAFNPMSYFTDNWYNADGYAGGENIYDVFLRIDKPLKIDAQGKKWDELDSSYGGSTQAIALNFDSKNYDGVVFKDINDSWMDDAELGDTSTVYLVSNPNQIKSADPVTYDASGNVIPLSQRFDATTANINYSIGSRAVLSEIDRVLDMPENPPSVPTAAQEGGKVRSIAKLFHAIMDGDSIDYGSLDEDGMAERVSQAGDRILDVLLRASYEFPNFASWYESRLKMALAIFQQLDPDVAKPDNQAALLVTLAITSNGADVATQTEDGWDVYNHWKQTGRLAGASEKRDALRGAETENKLAIADKMADALGGYAKLGEFLNRKGTVAELRKAMAEQLGGTFNKEEITRLTNGELIDEVVPFSLIFGPKLGSFFNNMSGDFSTITMDRWFMRTFGRTMGTQLVAIAKDVMAKKDARLKQALKGYKGDILKRAKIEKGVKDPRQIAEALGKFFQKSENRTGLSKQENDIRLAANDLFKVADGFVLKEAPDSGTHRRWIRAVMTDGLNKFNTQTGKQLVPAEAQALLWYYEKLIHDTLGSRQKDASPDYASAANKLFIRERGTGSDRFSDSDGIKRRSDGGRSAAFGGVSSSGQSGAAGVDNYSISTQSEIDRVQAAMGALDRSPLDTLEITEKLRKRFASIMAENMVELAAMRQGGVAEREVLDEEGNPIGPQPTGATTKATGAEIRRTKLLQALGELDGLLSALPPQVAAKVGGYTVLANIGTGDRALSNFFIKRLEMIDKELERYLKDRYTKALDQLFQRAKPRQDAAGKVPQGKLGASVHALFDELKLATKKTVVEVDGEVTSLEQQVASGELEPDMEAMKGLLADVLPLFANWATADASRMAQAVQIGFDILRKAYKRQRELTQIKRNQQEERRLVARESTGITGDIDEAINRQQNIAGKRWQQWKALNVNLFGFDQLISFVFGRDSKITKEIVNAQRKADNVKADELIGVWEEWQGVLAELAGIEDSRSMKSTHRGQDIVYRLAEPKTAKIKHTNMQGEQIELEFSQNQLITITTMWMQPKGRAHMMGKLDSDGNPIGDWHYDQDFVNRVEAKMTPEARAIRRFLLRKYAEEWSSINEVFVRLRGINMPQEDFYSPLGVDPVVAIDSGLLADPSTGFALSAPNRTPPALRSRGAAVAKPKFQDAVQVYFAHRKQMAHWKAYAEFNSDMLSVLGHRNTRNAVEAKGGVEALKTLNKWLTYMTQGGNIDAAAGLAMNEYFNGVMGRIASFILFGKVVTIAIQSTQLGAAAAKMPFPSYIKRLAKLLTGQMSWGASLRSPYIQRRIKEMPPQVQLAMEGLLANKPSYVAEAARRVGWYISGSDGLYTAGTYAMIYDYRLEQAKKAGLSGPEAERVAREEAERDTDEVAQPTRMGARSAFEATMTSPLARSAWAFGSDARKNWAMNSFLWFSNASADRKRQALYFTAAISTAMATVIRTIARDIKDDDDDELFDEKNWDVRRMVLMMATDFVYGFPVLGEMAEETAFRLFGEYRPQGSILSVGDAPAALSRMPQHIADTLNGEADTDKIVKDVNRMLQGMGLFAPQAASAAALSNAAKDLYEFTKPLWKDDE